MSRAIHLTEADEVALYNAVAVAEKYARGVRSKLVAREGMKVALRLGFPFKQPTDSEE